MPAALSSGRGRVSRYWGKGSRKSGARMQLQERPSVVLPSIRNCRATWSVERSASGLPSRER
eukprot:13811663-Alexandrium_andersonii.AAC.1